MKSRCRGRTTATTGNVTISSVIATGWNYWGDHFDSSGGPSLRGARCRLYVARRGVLEPYLRGGKPPGGSLENKGRMQPRHWKSLLLPFGGAHTLSPTDRSWM